MILLETFLQFLVAVSLVALFFYMRRRLRWKRLHRYESKISGHIDICEKYNGERVLMTNYFVQGVSIEEPSISKSYWYKVSELLLTHNKGKKEPTVLFIGLGANTSSLLVNRKKPNIHQVIVEIDPLVIRACREFFHLDELKNTDIITADIFALLKKNKSSWKGKFDSIVIDTFDAEPPYLLHGSHDPTFLNQLFAWLKNDGMFIFNIPVKTTGKNVPLLLQYLEKQFKDVDEEIIKDPRGYRNHVISAVSKRHSGAKQGAVLYPAKR